MKKGMFLLVLLFVIAGMWVSSCTQNKPTGLIGPGRIPLTPTPTLTPDVNYVFKLHQEETPVAGVQVTLLCADKNISLKAETDEKGEAAFKVNEYGTYTASVDSFDGFKSQVFPVDPIAVTYTAIDYGIPRLELELVEGSELIPIWENTLQYKITYRTKFERPILLGFELDNTIGRDYDTNYLSNDMDESRWIITIPKSFENYNSSAMNGGIECEAFKLIVTGVSNKGKNVFSNTRNLIRNWWFSVEADFHFMSVYDDELPEKKVSFYTGLRNIVRKDPYNVNFTGTITYEFIEAALYVTDQNKDFYKNITTVADGQMPGFTYFGNYTVLARIRTDALRDHAWKIDSNNGWMKVRIKDQGNLDVIRTFSTKKGWGETCLHEFCRFGNEFVRTNRRCAQKLSNLNGNCVFGTHIVTDISRRRSEKVTITFNEKETK